MDLTNSQIASAIQTSSDWKGAADAVVALFAKNGRCYSSGEVAASLRLNRTDLVFSVPTLGKYLRDQFFAQALPEYADPTDPTVTLPPAQVPRFTVGKFPARTPANAEVFVYGPDAVACNLHEFEVFIPKPGETMADAPAPATTATNAASGPGTSAHAQAVAIYGAQPAVREIVATVWPDGRLCVPRTAFEAACLLGGTVMRAGEPVFVEVEPGVKATISLVDPGTGAAKSYSLWKDQGRIAFPSNDPNQPFQSQTNYTVEVEAGKITVDLTKPR